MYQKSYMDLAFNDNLIMNYVYLNNTIFVFFILYFISYCFVLIRTGFCS